MLSEKEYKNYYNKKGRTIDQISISNNPLNERQLLSKYLKYCKKEEKKMAKPLFKVDEQWRAVKKLVSDRDKGVCQLMNKLPIFVKQELIYNSAGLYKILDPAHRLGKGAYPKFKYSLNNIWTLNRYSHSMLDQLKDPIKGKIITKKEHDIWWEIIVGEKTFEEGFKWQEKH